MREKIFFDTVSASKEIGVSLRHLRRFSRAHGIIPMLMNNRKFVWSHVQVKELKEAWSKRQSEGEGVEMGVGVGGEGDAVKVKRGARR